MEKQSYTDYLATRPPYVERTPITFTTAAEILLDGGVIIFTAENNSQPEEPGFEFQIISFDELCEQYRRLRIDYFNIQLYAV